MKKILIVVLALCLMVVPALALADSTLRAEGSATLSVAPDQAILSVGCAIENAESSVAQQQAADAINAIIAAVKGLGLEDGEIATASLNIYPVYNYTDGNSQVRGYRVEHMLSITVNDLKIVGDVMDAALKSGANQAYGITFVSSRQKDVYLQALAMAVENAAAKADALAIAAGVWLGGLEQINEMGGASYSPMYGGARADSVATGSVGDTIMAGELQVTASVELVYSIR